MDPRDPDPFERWNPTSEPVENSSTPPPVPPEQFGAPPPKPNDWNYRAFDATRDPVRLVDRLLRRPGQLAYEITNDGRASLRAGLLLMVVVTFALYGILVGSFSGGAQFWQAPMKICAGILASAAICLPSLYIFTCLSGGSLSLSRTAGLLMEALALCGVLLCGFLPVVWLFGQSTHSATFMASLHWGFWLICLVAGLRLLAKALERGSGGAPSRGIAVWCVIFALVVFQMATFVRPLVGPAIEGQVLNTQKMGFLEHWNRSSR